MRITESFGPDVPVRESGPLATFADPEVGVLTAADVHVAKALGRIAGENDPDVLLAAAFAVRAVRRGSVCVDLTDRASLSVADERATRTPAAGGSTTAGAPGPATTPEPAGPTGASGTADSAQIGLNPGSGTAGTVGPSAAPDATASQPGHPIDIGATADDDPLPWPDPERWLATCATSRMVTDGRGDVRDRPLRLVDGLLYLERYWLDQEIVRTVLDRRAAEPAPLTDAARVAAAAMTLFPPPDDTKADGGSPSPGGPGAIEAAPRCPAHPDAVGTDGPAGVAESGGASPDHQRLAAAAAATGWVTIIAGGPGTGKTTTVARLLALLAEVHDGRLRIALTAPTGKAAARLGEAVGAEAARLRAAGAPAPPADLQATTLHKLLGARPGAGFRHGPTNRLAYEVVVVDETSMVSLSLMARLMESLRPGSRLVLVGDPDQLSSVDAGAVLGDLVRREPRPGPDARSATLAELLAGDLLPADEVGPELRADVVRLRRTHRFGTCIGQLAAAVRDGDADRAVALLDGAGAGDRRAGSGRADGQQPGCRSMAWLPNLDLTQRAPDGLDDVRADVVAAGTAMIEAARAGDADAAIRAMSTHRVLCAHRRGPFGALRWGRLVEGWLRDDVPGFAATGEWYVGRPLLVTSNDADTGLFNGDTGVIVADDTLGVVAAFERGGEPLRIPVTRLAEVQTVHAMTVHKAQGSQFARVTVVMPPIGSPLLTRELMYTAMTRARDFVRLLGPADAVATAVRTPVVRASGLGRR